MKFLNKEGLLLVKKVSKNIQDKREYLSDIDGAIGDGDHGINMSKGFALVDEALNDDDNLSSGLAKVSDVLMNKIGGSMGPLYGYMFKGMEEVCENKEEIDDEVIVSLFENALDNIGLLTDAKVGDKSLIDVLVPSVEALKESYESSKDIKASLLKMQEVAHTSLENTKNLKARIGRASRLGDKSIGHLDAGASSCTIIIDSIIEGCLELLKD